MGKDKPTKNGPDIELPELPPFAPPADYSFEPELQGPTPREIPPHILEGKFARGQARSVTTVATIAVACILIRWLPFYNAISLRIPALAYIHWVGMALLAWAFWLEYSRRTLRGPYRYVQNGQPIVGRIRAIWLQPAMVQNGVPSTYHFRTITEFHEPTTHELVLAQINSEQFGASKKDKVRATYRVGDYATLAHLPERAASSVQLYGFLGLRDELGVVSIDDAEAPENSPWITAVLVAMVAAVFLWILWSLYALTRYKPIEGIEGRVILAPAVVGGVFGLLLSVVGWLNSRRNARTAFAKREANRQPGEAVELKLEDTLKPRDKVVQGILTRVVAPLGAVLMGAIFAMSMALTLNALADRSNAKLQFVRIADMIQTTHTVNLIPIWRDYSIKFQFPDQAKVHSHLSSPQAMSAFHEDAAIAHVKDGLFGWPWVADVTPIPDELRRVLQAAEEAPAALQE